MEPQPSLEIPAYSFLLQTNRADKLNFALPALTDSEFNPEGLARIDVDHEFLEITVRKDIYTCYFRLKASGMIKYECKNPVKGKMVNLKQVFGFLGGAAKDDIITICLREGSSELSLMFGEESNRPAGENEFFVELLEAEPQYGKCPDVTFMTEAVVLTQHLRHMIPSMVKDNVPQPVRIKCTQNSAVITLGEMQWPYNYDDKTGGVRGLGPRELSKAMFTFPYTDTLMIASFLAPAFLMCVVFKPYDCMMLRFCLRELGDLVYLIPQPAPLIPPRLRIIPGST